MAFGEIAVMPYNIETFGPLAQRLEQRTHNLLTGYFAISSQPLDFPYTYMKLRNLAAIG